MGLRVCACIGCSAHLGSCPDLTAARHCPACAAQREQTRGTRQQRGYGKRHDDVRARLVRQHIPGTPCPKCALPMWDTRYLDAGHSVDLRDNPTAVADRLEHRACNRGWRRGQ